METLPPFAFLILRSILDEPARNGRRLASWGLFKRRRILRYSLVAGGFVLAGATATAGVSALATGGAMGVMAGGGMSAVQGRDIASGALVEAASGMVGGYASSLLSGSQGTSLVMQGLVGGAADGAVYESLHGGSLSDIAFSATVNGTLGAATGGLLRGAQQGIAKYAKPLYSKAVGTVSVAPNRTLSIVNRSGSNPRTVEWFDQAAVLDDMATSPIGRTVLDAAQSHQFRLEFSSSFSRQSRIISAMENRLVAGEAFRRKAKIFLPAHKSNAGVASTAIHEGIHMLGVRGSQKAEVLARIGEMVHRGEPLTPSAVLRIKRQVQTSPAYSKLPWKINKSSEQFPRIRF